MKKRDPYNYEKRWTNWKESVKDGIPELSKANSDIILECLTDLELGLNVSDNVPKGARAPARLQDLKSKLILFAKLFEQKFKIHDMTKLTEVHVFSLFKDFQDGNILTEKGNLYRCVDSLAKDFKTFWNWYIKAYRKKGIEIKNIVEDLSVQVPKPDWVYLTEDQVKRMCEGAKYEYRVLIWFLYDTGIRAPTELVNIRVSDLSKDCKELNIRGDIAKRNSFGRRINLMLCSDLLRDYIKTKDLKGDDFLFNVSSNGASKYLKRLAVRLFGDIKTEAGHKMSQLTMYDFRHNSCCYWLPRYKSESSLKYRFGWKKSDKIHYYSELLGMKDTITQEDLLIDVTKTELEKRLVKAETDNNLLKEDIGTMKKQMMRMQEIVDFVHEKLIQQPIQEA